MVLSRSDLTNAFCDVSQCHAVIGGPIVYREAHHLSGPFTLTPRLAGAIPN